MSRRRQGNGLAHRYRSLKVRHGELEERISDEMARPLPDFLTVQTLKRRRLKTRDELETIAGVMRTVTRPELPGAA